MRKNIIKALFTISAMTLLVFGGYSAQSVTASSDTAASTQEYVKSQSILFTDAAGNTIPVLVRTNEEETVFNLQFDYYGLDANLNGVKTDDGQYHITDGEFFQTNGQTILKEAAALGNWTELS
ncbi:hypothetical protein [Ruminococcus sp. 5_1_39BFAA]|uniref:hypothetical protein n=1 Tax=Ruminococcus sp. 5_1_39BFAA TaxID=457412 RepID=UPI0035667391